MTKRKFIITTLLLCIGLCGSISALCYCLGLRHCKKVAVDFNCNEPAVSDSTRYKFLENDVSDYICELSNELDLDSDLVVAILMTENPEFNPEATHRNENGTIDVGMFQLNDYYLWSTFKKDYWFENIELNPFNWKHNTYIALHHIKFLQGRLKVTDDIVMAYNGGIGAVMNNEVKPSTFVYLAKVKNNMWLLKNCEKDSL